MHAHSAESADGESDRTRSAGSDHDLELRIRLLGGFVLVANGRAIETSAWRLHKARSLVKLLALAPHHRLLREQVLDLLWPAFDPTSATNNLYQTLHAARRALSAAGIENAITTEQGMLVLGRDDMRVDVDEFEEAAAAAAREPALAALRLAVSRYGGELLPEDRYEDWAVARRESLQQTYMRLLIDLARAEDQAGVPVAAIDALQRVVALDPTHDVANAELMRLYAVTGQRQQAIRQYEQLRDALQRDLAVDPDPEIRTLYERIRTGDLAPASPPVAFEGRVKLHNIPADLTTFVGRENETSAVAEYLANSRLVTLTGAAGAGKTRLALHVARETIERYPDGAWLVDLTAVAADTLVASALARVFHLSGTGGDTLHEALIDALASKHLLLVLDNCEHVITESAALVEALLRACPNLHTLCTSRETLGIPGEVTVAIPPLPVPADHAIPDPMAVDSVRLLVERIRYRRPNFTLTPDLVPAAIEICRRLEGLPLAVELAAARVGLLSLPQIAERLSDALPLLTAGGRNASPRQRTLGGALDWSYNLLPEEDRQFFLCLAPFMGGFTLPAALAVADRAEDGQEGGLDTLSRLVDRSLVTAEPTADQMRYRLLEPIRQYAFHLLQQTGADVSARERHARYFTALAERARPELAGPEQGIWLARLEREHDNMRAALVWTRDANEGELGLRLVSALWLFWYTLGHLHEGERWLTTMLARTESATPNRASAVRGLGALLYKQRRYEEALAAFDEALALFRDLGDMAEIANCLSNIALLATDMGDHERAFALHQEVLEMRRGMDLTVGMASTLTNLAVSYYVRGEYGQARDLQLESLRLQREFGDWGSAAISLNNLAEISLLLDDVAGAETSYAEGLALGHEVHEMEVVASCCDGLATVALIKNDPERAVRLHGTANELRRSMGAPVHTWEEPEHAATWHRVRGAMGAPEFDRLEAEGARMSAVEAVAYALGRDPED